MRMHDDQLDVDEALVHRLLAAQFPQHAGLPLRPVASWGTVNAVFRLGEHLVVRVPLQPGGSTGIDRECHWLPVLGPHLPVRVPEVVGRGEPQDGYPNSWSILTWLAGTTPVSSTDGSTDHLADALAGFLLALWAVDPAGGPAAYRQALAGADHAVRTAIVKLNGTGGFDGPCEEHGAREFDGKTVSAIWERARQAGMWAGPPVRVHGDVLPGNLLLAGGRLAGVIDFGATGVGDPAVDLMIAWHLFSPPARARFRGLLGVDDETWARGRGWALAQGLMALPYYRQSNPGMAAAARHAILEVTREHRLDRR